MKRNGKGTKRNRQNILRQGLAAAMTILLVMPVLPAKATEIISMAPESALIAMAAGAGVDAVAGSAACEILPEAGEVDGKTAVGAEIAGGISPALASDGHDINAVQDINDTHKIMEESVSGGNAVTHGTSLGETRAAASTGTIGQPDENGNVLEWSYDDSTKTLKITGSGVTSDWELWRAPFDSMGIKKIVFRDCKIAGSMRGFFRDLGVEEIDLSGADTSKVTDMRSMFYGCSSLSSLDVSGFDTAKVTDMGWMFYDCSSLENLNLGNFDTGSVTDMSYMFCECSSLSSLDVSGFDTTNVADMEYMFSRCSNLSSLDVSGFDTTNVADMEYMFFRCSSLSSLDVSGFDTAKVTDMSYMFCGCSSLSSLDVSGFDTAKVTDMGWMFYGCSSLSSLDVSGFDTAKVTDMSVMFYDCSSLENLNLGNFDTAKVTDMVGMFYGCSSLSSLDVSGFDTAKVTDMGYMFSRCSSLSSLDVSGFDTAKVTDMGWMFSYCSSLENLNLGNFDTGSVTDMRGMFHDCRNLSVLHTPYNVKVPVELPTVSSAVWYLPDGTEVTELPQNLSTSVLLTRTPVITTTTEMLNMPDVIRVKYVPYSYTVQTDNADPDNQVKFSVVEGRLADGLQMYSVTGEIYGVPLEAGEFHITVQADYSNPKYPSSQTELTLIVLENTDSNVGTATDAGYEITQPVPSLNIDSLSGSDTSLLISEGEYGEFQDAVYLDGRRLQSGTEYTSESGSTRIIIQNQTFSNAREGSHTLSLEFRTQNGDLRRAAQNLVISGTGSSGDTGNEGSTDNSADAGLNTAPVSGTAAVIDYIVQPGDNLWMISKKFFGNGGYWKRIYMDNMDIISNPDRLRVGQHIKICLTAGNGMAGVPATAFNAFMPIAGNTYAVQPGDTLWRIAGQVYGKNERWGEIYEVNRTILSDPKRIYPKQTLIIP